MQVMSSRADALAAELSRSWRELGGILASRRTVASIGGRGASRLTPTKVRALDLLAEHDSMRVRDLAAGMAVDETTVTRLVDRLETMGVARRERSRYDGRVTLVVPTPAGKRLVAAFAERRHAFFRDILEALEPDERAELVRLTAKATAALRARTEELVAP